MLAHSVQSCFILPWPQKPLPPHFNDDDDDDNDGDHDDDDDNGGGDDGGTPRVSISS
jgi:hypothetical protein